jgi:hypothetical protein
MSGGDFERLVSAVVERLARTKAGAEHGAEHGADPETEDKEVDTSLQSVKEELPIEKIEI